MSILIKDIQRNSNEIIRIEVSEFKGRELINIRIWYQSIDAASGKVVFKPTQKGVALNINEFEHLKDGINRLEHYIKDKNAGKVPEQPVKLENTEVPEENAEENPEAENENEDTEEEGK